MARKFVIDGNEINQNSDCFVVAEIPVNGSNLDALNYHNLSADKLVESINLKLFNEKL